jgi:hypothetical protein
LLRLLLFVDEGVTTGVDILFEEDGRVVALGVDCLVDCLVVEEFSLLDGRVVAVPTDGCLVDDSLDGRVLTDDSLEGRVVEVEFPFEGRLFEGFPTEGRVPGDAPLDGRVETAPLLFGRVVVEGLLLL